MEFTAAELLEFQKTCYLSPMQGGMYKLKGFFAMKGDQMALLEEGSKKENGFTQIACGWFRTSDLPKWDKNVTYYVSIKQIADEGAEFMGTDKNMVGLDAGRVKIYLSDKMPDVTDDTWVFGSPEYMVWDSEMKELGPKLVKLRQDNGRTGYAQIITDKDGNKTAVWKAFPKAA